MSAKYDPDELSDSSIAQRKSEERFRVALAHSGVVVFEHDLLLRYTWIYPTQFYAIEEVLGKTDAQLFPTEDAQRLMTLKRRVLETGVPAKEEVSVIQSGTCYEFILTVVPLEDGQGNRIGLTGASSNITAAKQAQRKLAEALEFRDRVIGILGHDLRNPLDAISASTELLLHSQEREDLKRPLLRIHRSAQRMEEMIRTLLDFADTRFNGRLPLAPIPMSLAQVIRGVIEELMAARAARPQILLQVEDDAQGRWDAARLAQVASNLIGNALTHGAADSAVRVTIRAEDAHAVFDVANSGPAIPAQLLAELFKPFRPGLAAAKPSASHRGLGLGLYIADQIVRAHGGSIAVRSTAQEGTVFSVYLPRAEALAE